MDATVRAPGGTRVVKWKGRLSRERGPGRCPREGVREAPGNPWTTSHPISPPEFPKARSAAEDVRAVKPSRTVACEPQEEVTFRQSRGFYMRLPTRACPRVCLGIMIANGQQSTDPDRAGRFIEEQPGLRLRVPSIAAGVSPSCDLRGPTSAIRKDRSHQRYIAVVIYGQPTTDDYADLKPPCKKGATGASTLPENSRSRWLGHRSVFFFPSYIPSESGCCKICRAAGARHKMVFYYPKFVWADQSYGARRIANARVAPAR